jgi:CubicO group peptidase (beta-lactamase class C family)
LNRGRWQDKQLVPSEWIRQATRPQVPPAGVPVANTDRKSIDGRGVYGFNWWVNGVKPNGKKFLEHAPAGTFLAQGLHHNILMVIPEWEMVIVRMGEDGPPTPSHDGALDRYLHRLAQAVSPLDPATGNGR